jgi:hypothetical protein
LGIEVPPDTWRGALKFCEESGFRTGRGAEAEIRFMDGTAEKALVYEWGWDYTGGIDPRMRDRPRIPPISNGIRIMTSLATIAICKSELARQKELDPATAQRLGAMEWGALA